MAFPIGTTILPGYPMPLGDKYLMAFDRTGPTSYTQFTVATGLGGDIILANGGGLTFGGFDYFDTDTADTTGQIQAFPVFTLGGYGNAIPQVTILYYSLVTASVGGQSQTLGTQVIAATNLSTFSWRFRAVMV